jgi:nitrate reductase gamma subunit
MKAFVALVAVLVLVAVGLAGPRAPAVFAIALPYAAMAIFLFGVIARVVRWARSPVPFRIPTTCGQEKSLPWIKHQPLESPHSTLAVIGRMALEILTFRSLFRNTRMAVKDGPRLVHKSDKYLWLGAIAFHYAFLVVVLRHLRLFLEPVPGFITTITHVDGFFEFGVPEVYITTVVLTAGLAYLLWRRFANPQVRYISLAADYFPLFLLLGIAVTGILMRHFVKTDVVGVKELAVGLVTFHPKAPVQEGAIFYVHLLLVSTLLAYFPFSKLVHMAGVFMSPTRNLTNDNREHRHLNPWNPTVKTHSYEEWEEDFHDKIEAAGLPLEHEHKPTAAAAAK